MAAVLKLRPVLPIPKVSMFHPRRAVSLLAPAAVLCLFAALLPATLPQPGLAPSSEVCLTMADTAPAPGPAALDRMERCSRLVAPDVELMADLGATYEAEQAPAKAVTIYRRALVIDPEDAELRVRLARLALGRGALGEARHEAEAALRLQPNRQTVIDLLRVIDAAPSQ